MVKTECQCRISYVHRFLDVFQHWLLSLLIGQDIYSLSHRMGCMASSISGCDLSCSFAWLHQDILFLPCSNGNRCIYFGTLNRFCQQMHSNYCLAGGKPGVLLKLTTPLRPTGQNQNKSTYCICALVVMTLPAAESGGKHSRELRKFCIKYQNSQTKNE